MSVYIITIPNWIPARLNAIMGGRRKGGRLKKRDRHMIAVEQMMRPIPEAATRRKVTIEITFAKGDRAGDPDCYHKSVFDALVHAKLLVNDTHRWVEMTHPIYLPVNTRHRTEKRMTRIFLEDI